MVKITSMTDPFSEYVKAVYEITAKQQRKSYDSILEEMKQIRTKFEFFWKDVKTPPATRFRKDIVMIGNVLDIMASACTKLDKPAPTKESEIKRFVMDISRAAIWCSRCKDFDKLFHVPRSNQKRIVDDPQIKTDMDKDSTTVKEGWKTLRQAYPWERIRQKIPQDILDSLQILRCPHDEERKTTKRKRT